MNKSLKREKDASLGEELPYWDFEAKPFGHAVLVDGSLVSGLKASVIDIECFSDSEVNALTQGLRSALDSLAEGTSLQFALSIGSDFGDVLDDHRRAFTENVHPLVQKIADSRCEGLRAAEDARTLYRPRLMIYVRTEMATAKKAPFWKKRTQFAEEAATAYQETLEILSQNMDAVKSSLDSVGVSNEPLSREEMLQHIYRFLNPRRSLHEPTPRVVAPLEPDAEASVLETSPWLAPQSPREQLVFGDLLLGMDQFVMDGYAHRLITLKTLPEVTFAGQLNHFLRLPFHYDLLLSLDVPPQSAEMAKLQQRRKMAHSMSVTQGNRASDIESETKLSSTEELIRELLNTGQRIYAVQLSIVLKAPATTDGNKKLDREVREVLARFRSLQGAEGLEESVGAWKILKGSFPAAPIHLERPKKMKTHNLADFLPIYGPRLGDQDPAVIFRNRMNGLVSFNPFDSGLPNYNCLVTGSSGAGKSFLNNCILLQELARGLRVFIVDIGGSYKKITESLGGQYVEVNLTEQYKINPFDIPDPTIEPTNQKIKSLLAVVECMVAENDQSRLGKLEKALLEKAIIDLYAAKRVTGEIPTLSNLSKSLAQFEETSMRSIAKMLYLWTGERPYGRLLDGQGGFRSDANICAFDLKGLSSHRDLQSVMILILTDFILAQVEKERGSKKRIILDEAWELLKSEAAAGFMEYCARTLRKTGSGITFITQGVEEIAASPIGAAILNNTATKFVMLQRGDVQILVDTLKLNARELDLIHSLQQRKGEFSEAFMIEGDHRQVVRVYPSAIEYWLSTSDAQDNHHLETLRTEGFELYEAIDLAASTYPHGVAAHKKEIA